MAEEQQRRGYRSYRSRYRRPSVLGVPSGAIGRDTEHLAAFDPKQKIARSQSERRADTLGPLDGNMGDHTTAARDHYQDISGYRPPQAARPGTTLRNQGLDFTDGTSKNDYTGEWNGRTGKVRPSSTLRPDGLDFGDGTSKDDFMQHDPHKRRSKKVADTLGPLDGSINGDTINRTDYGQNGGQRSDKMRPSTTMKGQGLDFGNGTSKDDFAQHDPHKRRSKKVADTLGPLDGSINGDTINRTDYGQNGGQRSDRMRPSTTMKGQGLDFANGTSKDDFYQHDPHKRRSKKVADTLGPLDGSMDENTINRTDYNHQGGQRSDRMRPSTTMKGQGLDFTDGTSKNDYTGEWNDRTGKVRPSSTLRPDGLDFADGTSKDDFLQHDPHKRRSKKVSDTLGPLDGDLDEETENKQSYTLKDAERARKMAPRDKLGLSGDRQWNTDKEDSYVPHDARKRRSKKVADTLGPLDGDLDEDTENKQSYTLKDAEKARKVTPRDKLGLSGDRQWNTDKEDSYVPHDARKRHSKKVSDTLGPLDGDLETNTETGTNYLNQMGRRSTAMKRADTLAQTGDMDLRTHKRQVFRRHSFDEGRIRAKGRADTLVPPKDEFGGTTESMDEFNAKSGYGRRQRAGAPAGANLGGGDMTWETDKGEAYTQHNVARTQMRRVKSHIGLPTARLDDETETRANFNQKKWGHAKNAKVADHLGPLDGGIDGITETQEAFIQQARDRRRLRRPNTHVVMKGDFDGDTETRKAYGMQDDAYRRPEKARMKDNLLSEGGIEGVTEYSDQFLDKKGDRADYLPWEDLVTPYGHLEPDTRRLGQLQKTS